MATTADTYGNMTVLTVAPGMVRQDGEAFRSRVTEAIRAGGRWFVLDLARATSLDSQGLEDLLWFQEEVEGVGGVVKLAGLNGPGRKVFEMVRFDKKFEIFEDVHDAVRSFE